MDTARLIGNDHFVFVPWTRSKNMFAIELYGKGANFDTADEASVQQIQLTADTRKFVGVTDHADTGDSVVVD